MGKKKKEEKKKEQLIKKEQKKVQEPLTPHPDNTRDQLRDLTQKLLDCRHQLDSVVDDFEATATAVAPTPQTSSALDQVLQGLAASDYDLVDRTQKPVTIRIPKHTSLEEAKALITQGVQNAQKPVTILQRHKSNFMLIDKPINTLFMAFATQPNSPYYHDVVLLKIKKIILAGHHSKREYSHNPEKAFAESTKYYNSAVTLFCILNKKNPLNFSHDEFFQEEMLFAFRFLHASNTLEKEEKSIMLTAETEFQEKCSNNYTRLSIIYHLTQEARKLFNLESAYKMQSDYKRTFFFLLTKISNEFSSKKENTKSILQFIFANFMGLIIEENLRLQLHLGMPFKYDLTNIAHHAAIPELVKSRSNEKLQIFLNLSRELLIKYVDEPMRHFSEVSVVDEKNSELLALMLKISNTYMAINKFYAQFYVSMIEKLLADPKLRDDPSLIQQTKNLLAAYNDRMRNVHGQKHAAGLSQEFAEWQRSLSELSKKSEEYAAKIIGIEKLRKYRRKSALVELRTSLLEWEKKKPLRRVVNEQGSKPVPPKGHSSIPPSIEEPQPQPETVIVENTHLLTAEATLKSRKFSETLKAYELAEDDGKTANDALLQLRAIDGKIKLQASLLLNEYETITFTLRKRIDTSKVLSREERQALSLALDQATNKLRDLAKANNRFTALARTLSSKEQEENREGIIASNQIYEQYIKKIKHISNQIKEDHETLKIRLKERRRRVIQNIAEDLVKYRTFTNGAELLAAAEKVFRNIGKEKLRNKEELSKFAEERLFFNRLTSQIDFLNNFSQQITPLHIRRLPTSYATAWSHINKIPGRHYLVGSRVIQVILGKDLAVANPDSDFDFVAFAVDEKGEKDLIESGFNNSGFNPYLYIKKDKGMTIDCLLAKKDLSIDSQSRDFTICSVYLDEYKEFHDPTGMGIADIETRTLRMIGDPVKRLQEDPVRLLRAVKYMLAGFAPDETLLAAIKSYQPNIEHHRDHLNAVLRKQLQNTNSISFIACLQKHGLLSKLFAVSDNEDTYKVLHQLSKQPDEKKTSLFHQGTFFSKQHASNRKQQRAVDDSVIGEKKKLPVKL